MAVLQSTNVQGTLCVNGVAVGGGKDFKYCCFTASTTFTPTQDLVDGDGTIDTTLVGGGGGAGFLSIGTLPPAVGFSTNYAYTKCLCSGGGGGAGVGHYIQDITSTDSCTVTVGAGGLASAIVDMCYESCISNYNHLTSSGGTGGDSSFGDHTEYGGGAGRGGRCMCLAGGAGEVLVTTDETRNGADFSSFGGGAQDNSQAGGGYNSFGSPGPFCNLGINLAYKNRAVNWGSANTTSSQYHFFPKHEKIQSINAGCSNPTGYPAATFCSGQTVFQPFMQNNGVRIDGGKVVGTNKASLFENGVCACTLSPNVFCGNAGINTPVVCSVTKSEVDAINCGGGAGCMRFTTCSCNACGAYEFQLQHGKGGDGLVILKWFE